MLLLLLGLAACTPDDCADAKCGSDTAATWADRVAPAVTLDATVEGAVLTFALTATDAVGVVGTEALLDGAAVTSPTPLSDGVHVLEGRAWDAAGNVGTTTLEVGPETATVLFLTPADGADVSGTVPIRVEADYSAGIARLAVRVDGVELGSVAGDTLALDWESCGTTPGAHTIDAEVEATDGATATASIIVDIVDADGDGWDACSDCDDADYAGRPGDVEDCDDGIDQGCDGLTPGCGPEGELDPLGDVLYEGGTADPDNDSAVVVADFDEDGVNEVVVGCPNEGAARDDWEGAVYVATGASSGVVDLDAAVLHDGWVPYGAAGRHLAVADLDGEKGPELVVSEPGLNPSPRGTVYILTSAEVMAATPLEDVGLRLEGLSARDGVADGLSATDLDGDGFAELVAGAEEASGASGAIYVVHGPVDAASTFAVDSAIVGTSAYRYVGSSHCTGDYDGDGYEDVLVGTFQSETAAWLVKGPITGAVTIGSQADRLQRAATSDAAGYFMGCGDVDLDGIADPMVGAVFDRDGGDLSGAAYFMRGPIAGVRELWRADVIVHGDAPSMYVGYSMVTGDFDLDGLGDVVIGAPIARGYAGELFFFSDLFGGADIGSPTAHVTGGTYDGLGYGLFVGDATGDGVADVLAPSTRGSAGEASTTGSVRVWAGGGAF